MSHLLRALVMILGWGLVLGSAVSANAQGPLAGENHISARLVAETSAPKPGGSTELALEMTPQKGWHGYWENPGDAGLGMSLTWKLPGGVSAENLRYPVPRTLIIAGLMNHVYEGTYAPLVTLKIDPDFRPGTEIPIKVEAEWLACSDEVCVPESAELSTTISIGDGTTDAASQHRFDDWRRLIPAPLASKATFEVDGHRLRMAIPIPNSMSLNKPHFFARSVSALQYGAIQTFKRKGDMLLMETEAADPLLKSLTGVLKIGDGSGLDLIAAPGRVPQFNTESAGLEASNHQVWGLLLAALGGAMLGGLLLNIMPCVFPILSLKAISLVKAGGNESEAKRDALAYSAGVVAVCVGLGAIMLGLRAGGEQIGWAFQLQEPRIIFALLLVVSAMAFNLAGLFEFGAITAGNSLASGKGAAGSFWTGALAAFVATPCTAPFMAAAMGSALILPLPAALLVFAGLGIGLALPFLAIGFVPALRRLLPRPGSWMETFRRLMALPMFMTAVALIWLLGQQAGSNGMTMGIFGVLITVLALWWAGDRQKKGTNPATPFTLSALSALVATSLAPLASPIATSAVANTEGETVSTEKFSVARLAQLRTAKAPIFIYFTADWCITCKANEASAIQREATAKAFRDNDVVVLKGDWTRRDPEITRFLGVYGRSGVPLYIWYAPDKDPQILPQVLSSTSLIRLARK